MLMDDLRRELEKLQEAQAFAEHHSDQLSQQIVQLFELMHQLERRIQHLENDAKASQQPESEDPSPDHGGIES